MPSAAKQRLPPELWKNPERSRKSPVSSYHSNEIHAHPGYSDAYGETGSKLENPVLQKLFAKPHTQSNRRKKRNLQRRGSSDDIFVDHAVTDSSVKNTNRAVSAPVCSDSECGVSYNSSDCFANDSVKSPAVNDLPMPPTEWLKSFPTRDRVNSLAMKNVALPAFFGSLVGTQRRHV